jgi:hypothetical protein
MTKILAESAIEGRTDWFYGLQENIISGKFIPFGTNFKHL